MYRWILTLTAALALAACAESATTAAEPAGEAPAAPVAVEAEAEVAGATTEAVPGDAVEWPEMTVYKTPYCGCCVVWVDHMEQAGFVVETIDVDDLGPIKQEVGVPYAKGSCHTTKVGDYFVEGHVPAEDIKRLLTERPQALGLVLPGMPMGSPGMEMPDGRRQAFTVELVAEDGSTSDWAHHPGNS